MILSLLPMKSNRGFTLLELMIVIAIIGILAGAFFPLITGYFWRSRDTARITNIWQISTALSNYFTDRGIYPDTVAWWCVNSWELIDYMNAVPTDPAIIRRTSVCTIPGQYAYATGFTAANTFAYALQAKLESEPGWVGAFSSNYFTGAKYNYYVASKKWDVSPGSNSYFVIAR